MEIEHAISPAREMTLKHLEELIQQSFQQQVIKTKGFPNPIGWAKTIDIKPLEFYEGSIVTQGFTLDKDWKPSYIIFKTKHNRRKAKVIDALITPEIAVFYVDKDTRDWPYTEGCKLCCDIQKFFTGDGIISQIKTFSSPQGTLHFKHDPLLDEV